MTSDKHRLYLTLRSLPNDDFHWALVLAPKDPAGEWLRDLDGSLDLVIYEARNGPPWRYNREETNFFRVNPLNRILLGKFEDKTSADKAIDAIVLRVRTNAPRLDSQSWARRAIRALARRGVINITSPEDIEEEAIGRAEHCAHAQLAGILVNYREHTVDMRRREPKGVWHKLDNIRPLSSPTSPTMM